MQWQTLLWFSPFRCTSCTHLLSPQNTGSCSWSTSLWPKPDWQTSRSGKIVSFEENSFWMGQTLLCVTPCTSALTQVAIEDMGLYEDLSATDEAVQVLLLCLPFPFSSGKALSLSTSLPFQRWVCCQVSSFNPEVLVALNTGSPQFSWKLDSHFIGILIFLGGALHLCGVEPKCEYSKEIWGWNLHSAVSHCASW